MSQMRGVEAATEKRDPSRPACGMIHGFMLARFTR
jgi:hypothetical protein